MNKIKFSFVICAHKKCAHIEEALQSITTQDFEDSYEVIIVANACEDELFDYLQSFKNKNENENVSIKCYRTEIGLLSFNLNYAVNLATGDYVIRMDSDDISLPNRLSLTRELLEKHHWPDVLGGGATLINSKNEVIGKSYKEYNEKEVVSGLCLRNVLIHPATAIKKKSLISVKGYMGGVYGEDYELWVRMVRNSFRIVRVSNLLIQYRIHENQSRGNILSPADGASIALREFLLTGRFKYLLGVILRCYQFVLIKFES